MFVVVQPARNWILGMTLDIASSTIGSDKPRLRPPLPEVLGLEPLPSVPSNIAVEHVEPLPDMSSSRITLSHSIDFSKAPVVLVVTMINALHSTSITYDETAAGLLRLSRYVHLACVLQRLRLLQLEQATFTITAARSPKCRRQYGC